MLAFLFDNWDRTQVAVYALLVGGISTMTVALFLLSRKSVIDDWTGKVLYTYYPKANKAALVFSLIFVVVTLYIGVGWL